MWPRGFEDSARGQGLFRLTGTATGFAGNGVDLQKVMDFTSNV